MCNCRGNIKLKIFFNVYDLQHLVCNATVYDFYFLLTEDK